MEGWTVQRKKSRKSKSPYDMLKSYRDFNLFNQVVEFIDRVGGLKYRSGHRAL